MNKQPNPIRPVYPVKHQNHSLPTNGAMHHPPVPKNRAKPPSYSVAPWDVTHWIDPLENRNRKQRH